MVNSPGLLCTWLMVVRLVTSRFLAYYEGVKIVVLVKSHEHDAPSFATHCFCDAQLFAFRLFYECIMIVLFRYARKQRT